MISVSLADYKSPRAQSERAATTASRAAGGPQRGGVWLGKTDLVRATPIFRPFAPDIALNSHAGSTVWWGKRGVADTSQDGRVHPRGPSSACTH